MKNIKVTTIHPEIGYGNNVDIIETALREKFLFDDNSYVIKAVAAHIWSVVCGKITKTWGSEEVMWAIVQCQMRLNKMGESMQCTRKGCAISYPHVKHE